MLLVEVDRQRCLQNSFDKKKSSRRHTSPTPNSSAPTKRYRALRNPYPIMRNQILLDDDMETMRLERVRRLQEKLDNGEVDLSDDDLSDTDVANRREEDDEDDDYDEELYETMRLEYMQSDDDGGDDHDDTIEAQVKDNYANDEQNVKRGKVNKINEKKVNFETNNSTSIDPSKELECGSSSHLKRPHQATTPPTLDPPSSGLPYFPPLCVSSDNPFSNTYTSEHTAKAMLDITRENYNTTVTGVASKAVSEDPSDHTPVYTSNQQSLLFGEPITIPNSSSKYQRMQTQYNYHNDPNRNQDYIQMGNFTTPSVPYSCDKRPLLSIPVEDPSARNDFVVVNAPSEHKKALSPPPAPPLSLITKSSLNNNRKGEELATLDSRIASLETELSLDEEVPPPNPGGSGGNPSPITVDSESLDLAPSHPKTTLSIVSDDDDESDDSSLC